MLREFPPLGPRTSHDELLFMNPAPGPITNHTPAHEDPLDDVFGSAPASPALSPGQVDAREAARSTEPSDIPRLRSIHVTNGYREGIALSKEQYIQAGFDEGYSLGGEIGVKVGWCLGVLEGICAAAVSRDTDRDLAKRAAEVLAKAREDLEMEKILGPKWFGPDGIWLYEVPGHDEQDQDAKTTFGDVAAAHPVLIKWRESLAELAKEAGLALG